MKVSAQQARQLLERHLGLIEDILRWTAGRRSLSPEDTEELRSRTYLKLVEGDYAVLRKFRGACSVHTYLTVVVQRIYLDGMLRGARGRWRPSQAAQELGIVAVEFEKLTVRDGHSTAEAIATLEHVHDATRSRQGIEVIVAQLSSRRYRRPETVAFDEQAQVSAQTDSDLLGAEREQNRDKVLTALAASLSTLPEEEQTLLRLRYCQDVKVSRIAVALGLEQRPLYRRIARSLKILRDNLRQQGIGCLPADWI